MNVKNAWIKNIKTSLTLAFCEFLKNLPNFVSCERWKMTLWKCTRVSRSISIVQCHTNSLWRLLNPSCHIMTRVMYILIPLVLLIGLQSIFNFHFKRAPQVVEDGWCGKKNSFPIHPHLIGIKNLFTIHVNSRNFNIKLYTIQNKTQRNQIINRPLELLKDIIATCKSLSKILLTLKNNGN